MGPRQTGKDPTKNHGRVRAKAKLVPSCCPTNLAIGTFLMQTLDASQGYGSIPSDDHRLTLLGMQSHRQHAAEMLIYLADAYSTSEGTVVHSLVLLDRFLVSFTPNTASGPMRFIHGAIASFMISVKLREVAHPSLRDLERLTSCTCEQLMAAEEMVLTCLDWNVHSITGKLNKNL